MPLTKQAPVFNWHGFCASKYNGGMLRFFGLLFGIPILLLGTICMGVALASVIGNALNKNYHAIGAPLAVYGLPFVWLGYRLVFTRTRQAIHAQV